MDHLGRRSPTMRHEENWGGSPSMGVLQALLTLYSTCDLPVQNQEILADSSDVTDTLQNASYNRVLLSSIQLNRFYLLQLNHFLDLIDFSFPLKFWMNKHLSY
jgi:hypothetical protein